MTIPFHTPPELRLLSNIGHAIEGLLLGSVASVALAQACGRLKGPRWAYVWPVILSAAGLFLPVFLFAHPNLEELRAHARVILSDPQQQQHLVMALLLACSGIAEVLVLRHRYAALRILWPSTLVVIGLLFLLHPQHGTAEAAMTAMRLHETIGIATIASGIACFIARTRPQARWARVAWPLLLLVTAGLLVLYREPLDAFEPMTPAVLTDTPTVPAAGTRSS